MEDQQYTLRVLFEKLGVADSLEFVQEHDLYRAAVPGRHDVTLPADWAGAVDALEDAFPGNRARVERFFALARDVTFWYIAALRKVPADDIDPHWWSVGIRELQYSRPQGEQPRTRITPAAASMTTPRPPARSARGQPNLLAFNNASTG